MEKDMQWKKIKLLLKQQDLERKHGTLLIRFLHKPLLQFPLRRCRALYDCEADNDDELTFEEGDIILVVNEETEDENWMEGVLEADASRRGLFPVSFVHMLDEDEED